MWCLMLSQVLCKVDRGNVEGIFFVAVSCMGTQVLFIAHRHALLSVGQLCVIAQTLQPASLL